MNDTQIRLIGLLPKNPSELVEGGANAIGTMEEYIYSQQYEKMAKSNYGPRWRKRYVQYTVNLSASGPVNFPTLLPAYSRVTHAFLTYDTAVSFVTATQLGIGVTGHAADIILGGAGTTKNTQYVGWPAAGGTNTDNSTGATGLQLVLSPVNSSGVATGTATGTVRVNLIFDQLELPFLHP